MRELITLSQVLKNMDDDPVACMHFWESPTGRDRVVLNLLMDAASIHARHQNKTMDALHASFEQAASRLMSEFWAHTWPTHDCHFHKSFNEFVNCPFTCLTELADCVEKIAQGRAS